MHKEKEKFCDISNGDLDLYFVVPNDVHEIMQRMTELKKGAKELYTNLYLDNKKIDGWIAKGTLHYCMNENLFCLFHEREGYVQVYFLSKDLTVLEAFLKKFDGLQDSFVFDLIYPEKGTKSQKLKDVFNRAGFQHHIKMMRMMRVNKSGSPAKVGMLDFADVEDSNEIWEILHNFDSVDAQIPDLDEIETAAANKDIIVSRADGKIAAFFWTEHRGKTAFFRYWITRPEYRDAGTHGYFVYNQTLKREASAQRMILWVREDNANVIKIHQLKGFRFDGLVDDVFFKKGRGADD